MDCKQTKPDGSKCKAKAMTGTSYCFRHNPATEQARQQASAKGGSVSKPDSQLLTDKLDLKDPNNTLVLIADTIHRIRKVNDDGSMDIKTANAIGFLSSKLLEAQKLISLEARLAKLEATAPATNFAYTAEQDKREFSL
jgi:hypothetical protein